MAPTRHGFLAATRPMQSLTSASSIARRSIVTQAERWTPETARLAAQSNLIPDESGKGGIDLATVVPNIEARWAKMSKEEQYGVFRQLEELQRKDWKELSLDQKKAGMCLFPKILWRRMAATWYLVFQSHQQSTLMARIPFAPVCFVWRYRTDVRSSLVHFYQRAFVDVMRFIAVLYRHMILSLDIRQCAWIPQVLLCLPILHHLPYSSLTYTHLIPCSLLCVLRSSRSSQGDHQPWSRCSQLHRCCCCCICHSRSLLRNPKPGYVSFISFNTIHILTHFSQHNLPPRPSPKSIKSKVTREPRKRKSTPSQVCCSWTMETDVLSTLFYRYFFGRIQRQGIRYTGESFFHIYSAFLINVC